MDDASSANKLLTLRDKEFLIISGTASNKLASDICKELGVPLGAAKMERFSDGEIFVRFNESLREKDVFIVQTCAPPVNDNVMELLLSIAAAKRSGASSVTAVIPYFGYKHNRRGLPISTTHHSRFLWNAAGDLGKMLHTVGVDKVISVDLQRPGQGHEACLFNTQLPAETISTNEAFVTYFKDNINLHNKVVVVSPNTVNVKKARKFQRKLKALLPNSSIDYAAFLRDDFMADSDSEAVHTAMLGNDVQDSDVIIIVDTIDTGRTLNLLCERLVKAGARKVYVCASHGLLTGEAAAILNSSTIEKVVISDSIELSTSALKCSKIVQVALAPLLAKIIESDGRRHTLDYSDNKEDDLEEYELE